MAKNASFIEVNAPNYNRQAALDINLPLFAVLGATGVGKSSFITTLGGRHVNTNELPAIGHQLESKTEQCEIYRFESFATGPGYLIDTPGIDESNRTRTDTEIMNLIQNELERVQIYDKMLTGLVYLYDIRQPRVYGSTLNALDTTINMLEYLLGANGVAKITLVTTKWTKEASEAVKKDEERNERMLQDNYWGGPIRCGSTLERYDGTKSSGIDILANLRNRKRRMYPEPSRCRMSIQTPTQEPVIKPEPSHPTRTKGIVDVVSRTFFPPVEDSQQLDATAYVVIHPPWLWTPAWILIGTMYRSYLLLVIEERLRAEKFTGLSRFLHVLCAFYFFTIFQQPAWLGLWAWYVVKAVSIFVTCYATYITIKVDGSPNAEAIVISVLNMAGLVHVPLWLPFWVICIAEGLRFLLILLSCLASFCILAARKDNYTGMPRVSMTEYEKRDSS
ncbi:hypothetical protein AA0121_g11463 [Alternaria tenuissima]|nr:hypothetical protein AA0121_g11463 [Alternaria tenuissima]